MVCKCCVTNFGGNYNAKNKVKMIIELNDYTIIDYGKITLQ